MRFSRATAASAVATALALSTLAVTTASTSAAPAVVQSGGEAFHRLATYPVFQNAPVGVDPNSETVAEISTVTDDGNTVVYTDALGKRAGFLDITDPSNPKGLGSIDLAAAGHADDQPTSVAVAGDLLLVVVDTSGGDFVNPSGRLDVFTVADRSLVTSIDLGGQPDSIAISPDGAYAAIAMENQRDEEFTPAGHDEGDLPQAPAGFVQVIELGGDASTWTAIPIGLTQPDGTPLESFVAAGLDTPEDPEPEYVDINADNKLVLTLQENNGLVVIDLASKAIDTVFSAGNAQVDGVDTEKDGLFDPTGSIDAPREPDAVQWVGDDLVATANEGDWKGGTRGWSVFDVTSGAVVWDAGNSFEQIATRHGLHNNDRAGKKGAEPEGLAFDVIGGVPRAFVGSERSNFVAVYDMSDPTSPVFEQILPTTNGPEGLLPIPSRDLLVVSSEEDDASVNVRATIGVYELGDGPAAFPSILSADVAGQPIGWGALGALSSDPADAGRLYAASDAAYATGRIYAVDTAKSPAVIDKVIEVTDTNGTKPAIDIEGLHARADGGFWLALEGPTGAENKLARTDANGLLEEVIDLPESITSGLAKQGLEGVTAYGTGNSEVVHVTLQRAAADEDFVRIGRYEVKSKTWSWFAYTLESTEETGDWIGLSEITALGPDLLTVIERDKLNGPRAALKRLYTVDLSTASKKTVGTDEPARPVAKKLAVDLLPHLRELNGWTQEKVEGVGITGAGTVFVVTDNDGLEDATGETQLVELGAATKVFASALATKTAVKANKKKIKKGKKVKLKVTVTGAGTIAGTVKVKVNGKNAGTARVNAKGVAKLKVKLTKRGKSRLVAAYQGAPLAGKSTSKKAVVKVR